MPRNVGHVAALLATAFACLTPAGCGETREPSAERDAIDGWQRGELQVFISDDIDGRSQTSYYLGDTRLLFDSTLHTSPAPAPELISGVRVRVRGVETPDGLRVIDYQILPDETPDRITSALVGATPYAPRSFAMVLINLNGLGVNTDAANVMGRLVGNADSIRNYYLYDSYGMQDITAQVFGPINYTMPSCSNTDASNLSRDLRPMISGTFQHYLWYIGQTRSGGSPCTWGGLGSVGSPSSPARDTWYNGSSSCVVLVQEPGHNFGMQHSSSLACGTSAAFLDDPNGCTYSEYGDRFDPMGGGCRHMNAWQKQYQGWFGGCNGVRVYRSGTFTLLPLEPQCNGVQFLQIKMKTRAFNRPAGGGGSAGVDNLDWYYLELRTPVDFDGTLGNGTSSLSPRVLVHAGTNPRTRTQGGMHTYLLDMNPSTTGSSGLNDAGMTMGQAFNDPGGGLSFTVTALSATSATIDVKFTDDSGAAPTCLDNAAFTTPGPVDCGGTGAGGRGGSGGTGGAGGRGGAGGTGGSSAGSGGSSGGRGGAGGSTGGSSAGSGGARGGAGGSGGVGGSAGSTGTGGRGGAGGGVAGTGGGAGAISPAGSGGSAAGSGGAAGSGSAGTGTPGAGGSGGSASGGSAGGALGSAGAGGSGTPGIAGGGGTATGIAGDSGSTGAAGTSGIAGSGVTGLAGIGVPVGQGGQGGKGPGEIAGGCSCETAGTGTTTPGIAFVLALGAIAVGRARPRRGRSRARASSRSGISTTSGGSQ